MVDRPPHGSDLSFLVYIEAVNKINFGGMLGCNYTWHPPVFQKAAIDISITYRWLGVFYKQIFHSH